MAKSCKKFWKYQIICVTFVALKTATQHEIWKIMRSMFRPWRDRRRFE